MNKEDLRRFEALEARVAKLENAAASGDTPNPFTPVPHEDTHSPVSGAPVEFPRKQEGNK
jgi:hypothetical protein